jgi:hypothetical protein
MSGHSSLFRSPVFQRAVGYSAVQVALDTLLVGVATNSRSYAAAVFCSAVFADVVRIRNANLVRDMLRASSDALKSGHSSTTTAIYGTADTLLAAAVTLSLTYSWRYAATSALSTIVARTQYKHAVRSAHAVVSRKALSTGSAP